MVKEICGLCGHFRKAETTQTALQGEPKTRVTRTTTGLSKCDLSGLIVKYDDPSCRQVS